MKEQSNFYKKSANAENVQLLAYRFERSIFLFSKFSCFKTEFERELSCMIEKRDKDGFWNFHKDFL